MHSAGNYMRNNIVAGAKAYAYVIYSRGFQGVPILEFSGNEAYRPSTAG